MNSCLKDIKFIFFGIGHFSLYMIILDIIVINLVARLCFTDLVFFVYLAMSNSLYVIEATRLCIFFGLIGSIVLKTQLERS
jgi:hypothetical protein